MGSLRLIRAWACYWIMEAIGAAARPFPRSPARARIVNALCRPFFSYGAYWALRSNPREGWRIRQLEREQKDPHHDQR